MFNPYVVSGIQTILTMLELKGSGHVNLFYLFRLLQWINWKIKWQIWQAKYGLN